jgi:hypothetical protein
LIRHVVECPGKETDRPLISPGIVFGFRREGQSGNYDILAKFHVDDQIDIGRLITNACKEYLRSPTRLDITLDKQRYPSTNML